MNLGNVVGIALGVKLINGKIKPKFGKGAIIVIIVMFILLLASLIGFIYGLLNFDVEFIIMCACGLFGFGYLLLISPYTQSSKNYYIEFESENSLNNFKLNYKNKLVAIQYKIDNKGKIAFSNNASKLSCISYADGSKMSNLTKYKIINYFTRWLNDNNLMSNEITSTFEKL